MPSMPSALLLVELWILNLQLLIQQYGGHLVNADMSTSTSAKQLGTALSIGLEASHRLTCHVGIPPSPTWRTDLSPNRPRRNDYGDLADSRPTPTASDISNQAPAAGKAPFTVRSGKKSAEVWLSLDSASAVIRHPRSCQPQHQQPSCHPRSGQTQHQRQSLHPRLAPLTR
jgi:hypothetical protein